jgi:nitrogenase iron protein NifH
MRGGYADKVFVITSGENMAIHAAANIAVAIDGFKGRGYAQLGGIILNKRNVKDELAKVEELAGDINSEIIAQLSRSDTVQEAEDLGKTVIEAFPDSPMAQEYRELAARLLEVCGMQVPGTH